MGFLWVLTGPPQVLWGVIRSYKAYKGLFGAFCPLWGSQGLLFSEKTHGNSTIHVVFQHIKQARLMQECGLTCKGKRNER